jgi:FTR1 family protein
VGATFVIVLREGFEAALLLGIVCAYLTQIGHADSRRYVTLGATLAAAASVLMGLAVSVLSGPLADVGPDVIALVVIFAAVALLTWHGWWMGRHARELHGDLQRRVDAAHASHQLWMVGLIAFTGVFREGAETVLFLWGLTTQLRDLTGWAALGGAAAGSCSRAAVASAYSASSASPRSSSCFSPPDCSARAWVVSRVSASFPAAIRCGTPRGCSTITAARAASWQD